MSGAGSDDQGGAGRREVAYRVFAAEFEDADFSYSESDEERAPNYVVTPTGARVNRLFLVGVLTEVEQAGEDILRARVVDPTGAFVVYAGQYQPEAQAFFDRAEPPAFVAVTGKARTFQPDDSDVTYTSVRPENVNEVTAETRDRWSVGTARQTLSRVATMARALDREERGDELLRLLEEQGVDVGLAAGIPLAIDHYGTTGAYLESVRDLSVQVAEVVANERDEVEPFSASPDASGPADLAELATLDVPGSVGGDTDAVASSGTTGGSGSAETTGTEPSGTASSGSTSASSTSDTGSVEATSSDSATDSTATGESTATASSGGDADEAEPTASTETGETAAATEPSGSTESAEPTDATETAEATDATGTAEPTENTAESTGDVGGGAGAGGDIGDFEPGEFDLDEEEREAIEEEYGTSFQSGTEVDDPGEADIDTPEPDAGEEAPDGSSTAEEEAVTGDASTADERPEPDTGTDPATDDEPPTEETATDDEPPAEESASEAESATEEETSTEAESADEPADVDVDEAVMDAMRDNDGGEGASEEAIVDAVTDRLGVGEEEVREALEEALMGGQCYEPDDGVYKPI